MSKEKDREQEINSDDNYIDNIQEFILSKKKQNDALKKVIDEVENKTDKSHNK